MFRSSWIAFARAAQPKTALPTAVARHTKHREKLNVCVLSSDYANTQSATASVDTDQCSPAFWVNRFRDRYQFHSELVDKRTAYSKVRELVSSKKYDVYYNLCDGAKDEARAGVEVIRALEENNCAYTGANSRSFEPSKIDMKMALAATAVKYPNFVALRPGDSIREQCSHLRFPVIVKHQSGYASVGITAKSKCANMKELKVQVKRHILEYKHALVEEFIVGREGTIFVCADPKGLHGCKVFPPIMMDLGGPDDFAHFDNKWILNKFHGAGTEPKGLPESDPAYPKIIAMARAAFTNIMNGVGYGRCDFRIDDRTGDPYFLEINPNCGMLYPPLTGGCYADVCIKLDKDWDHDTFISAQIENALQHQRAREGWVQIAYNQQGQWTGQATKAVPQGFRLFPDATKIIPLLLRTTYDVNLVKKPQRAAEISAVSPVTTSSASTPTYRGKVGCLIYRADGIADTVVPIQHSCEPNMVIENGPTVSLVSRFPIKKGAFLTLDYATIRDPNMPAFLCKCGAKTCAGLVEPQKLLYRERVRVPRLVPATAELPAGAVSVAIERKEAREPNPPRKLKSDGGVSSARAGSDKDRRSNTQIANGSGRASEVDSRLPEHVAQDTVVLGSS